VQTLVTDNDYKVSSLLK